MQRIVVQRGASIIEVIEGRAGGRMPQVRIVGADIPTRGTRLVDEENPEDVIWEFRFQGRTWTVDDKYVEVLE